MARKKTTTKVYDKILRKDHDFDYAYLLILERFKLKRMIESFELASMPHENTWECVRDMKICVKCIDIILEDDEYSKSYLHKFSDEKFDLKFEPNDKGTYTLDTSSWETPTFDHHVNVKNAKRFDVGTDYANESLMNHIKMDLRQVKALRLYNSIRNKMFKWWW